MVRDRGTRDGMPAALWFGRAPSQADDPRTYGVGRVWQAFMTVPFVFSVLAAPFFVVAAVRTGLGVTAFVALWAAILVWVFRSWRRSTPSRLTLDGEALHIVLPGGTGRRIPISAVSEIGWPFWGDYVLIRVESGTLQVPKHVKGLDELVVELRRRNPSMRFHGHWPPRNVWWRTLRRGRTARRSPEHGRLVSDRSDDDPTGEA